MRTVKIRVVICCLTQNFASLSASSQRRTILSLDALQQRLVGAWGAWGLVGMWQPCSANSLKINQSGLQGLFVAGCKRFGRILTMGRFSVFPIIHVIGDKIKSCQRIPGKNYSSGHRRRPANLAKIHGPRMGHEPKCSIFHGFSYETC
jgi:hypothetical protein